MITTSSKRDGLVSENTLFFDW